MADEHERVVISVAPSPRGESARPGDASDNEEDSHHMHEASTETPGSSATLPHRAPAVHDEDAPHTPRNIVVKSIAGPADDDADNTEDDGDGGQLQGPGAVEMKPRSFFIGRNRVPEPHADVVPLNGLKLATAPGAIDKTRIPFSTAGLLLFATLILAAVALFFIPTLELALHDVSKAYRFGIPAVLLVAGLIVSFFVTATEVHFDRATRTVVIMRKRLFIGACCRGRREIPFSVLKSASATASHGQHVTLKLVIDTAAWRRREADEAEANTAAEQAVPAPGEDGQHTAVDTKTNDDEEDELLEIAVVENAPDVLRSWRRYVDWLRDDAF